MKKPLLSIVLITQGDSTLTFKRALDSALNQTYEEKEILVIDGNNYNSPYSLSLQESLAAYAGVEFLQPKQKDTKAGYRNLALEQVRGQYVAFMTGGDEWLPSKAALQMEQLLAAGGGAAVSCANGSINFTQPERISSVQLFAKKVASVTPELGGEGSRELSFSRRRLLMERPVRKCSQVIYKTSVLRRHGGFDERFETLVDLDWLLNWQENYGILFLPAVLFTTTEVSWKTSRGHLVADGRYILTKYADSFLADPKLAFDYCLLLGKDAWGGRLWLNLVICFFLSLFHSPLRFSAAFAGALWGTGKWLRRACLWAAAILQSSGLGRSASQGNREIPAGTVLSPDVVVTAEKFVELNDFHFARRKGLHKIVIPERVRVIKRGMFYGCSDLVSVTIPATVTRIEARAFQDCYSLASVCFVPGSQLGAIGGYAFAGCRGLEDLHLPGGLAFLGKGAFWGCERLAFIKFDSGFFPSAIGDLPPYVFAGCHMLQEIMFEPGSMLKRVGKGAFMDCRSLKNTLLTGAIDSIGAYAFSGCEQLEILGMPLLDAVESIGSHAFAGCARLAEIQVPHVLKRINRCTYEGCSAVKAVIIPEKVRSIKRQAFARCTMLDEVLLMNKLTHYKPSSFPEQAVIMVYQPGPAQDMSVR